MFSPTWRVSPLRTSFLKPFAVIVSRHGPDAGPAPVNAAVGSLNRRLETHVRLNRGYLCAGHDSSSRIGHAGGDHAGVRLRENRRSQDETGQSRYRPNAHDASLMWRIATES